MVSSCSTKASESFIKDHRSGSNLPTSYWWTTRKTEELICFLYYPSSIEKPERSFLKYKFNNVTFLLKSFFWSPISLMIENKIVTCLTLSHKAETVTIYSQDLEQCDHLKYYIRAFDFIGF